MPKTIEEYRKRSFELYQLEQHGLKAIQENDSDLLTMVKEQADVIEQQLVHKKLRDDIAEVI